MSARPVHRRALLLASSVLCASAACAVHTSPPPAYPKLPVLSGSAPGHDGALPPTAPEAVLDSSTALMPRAVTSFGAAVVDGAVYALGGYFGVPHEYSREGQAGEVWRLESGAHAFAHVADVAPVQGAALVGVPGGFVRVGGMRALNGRGEPERVVSLPDVAMFEASTGVFRELSPLPVPRSSHAVARLGSTVYVVGGWTLDGKRSEGSFADKTLAFDLTTQTYRALPQPFQLRALAVAELDGKLVALGGIDQSGTMSKAVHVLDPVLGTWARVADLPVQGFGMAATSNGDTLYASGLDGVLYALEEPGGSFKADRKLIFPRFFHQLVMLDAHHVAVLGGISGMHRGARIRAVEVVDMSQTAPRMLSFTLENPVSGKNRQGAFVHGDSLYVFGGNRSLAQHDFAKEDFVADTARLDLAGLSFEPLLPFPVARQTVQTLATDDGAFVVGGFGHDGRGARAFGDAFTFDAEQGRFQPATGALPTPRTQFGLTEGEGKRWVFGGLDFHADRAGEAQFEHPVSVLCAAPGEPFRESGATLPAARRAFGGASLAGRYYLVGGMAGGFAPVASCDVFELAAQSWSTIPCPKAVRISPQLVALDGKLYLAGGSSFVAGELMPNPSLEVFDPKLGVWTTLLETLPIEPRHLTMLSFQGGLLLYSAHDPAPRVHVLLVQP